MTKMTTRPKMHHLLMTASAVEKTNASIANIQALLRQVNMVNNFNAVISEHSVSAPVIATMHAVPEFEAAAKNFPEASQYNNIPSHPSDARYTMAMESLTETTQESVSALLTASQDTATAFKTLLSTIGQSATALKEQIAIDRTRIDQSDISETEVAMLQTTSLTEENISQMFAGLEGYLDGAAPFNVDHLRANPERLGQDAENLAAVIELLGPTLGLELTATGLANIELADDFIATEDFFEVKGITKAGLLFHLDRADSLCDQLIALADRQEEFSAALESEAADIPTALNSDDVTYGANDHLALMCCYTQLTTKGLKETINFVGQVITAADAVVDSIIAGETVIPEPDSEEVKIEKEPELNPEQSATE